MSQSAVALRNTPRWALLAFEQDQLACVIPLRTQPVFAGRGEHCDLRLSDHAVSREHCLFEVIDGDVMLVDMESRNGTLRFGRRLRRSRLHEGDEIALGNAMVKLVDLARPGWSIDGNLFGDLYLDVETDLLNWRGFLARTESLMTVNAGREMAMACLRLLGCAMPGPGAAAARRRFGHALREACGRDGVIAHQGSGEFASLFPSGGGTTAKAFLQRLRVLIEADEALQFAAGIAVVAGEAATFSSLWCAAQDELYIACADPERVSVKQRLAED